jgi:hypothetical protein
MAIQTEDLTSYLDDTFYKIKYNSSNKQISHNKFLNLISKTRGNVYLSPKVTDSKLEFKRTTPANKNKNLLPKIYTPKYNNENNNFIQESFTSGRAVANMKKLNVS